MANPKKKAATSLSEIISTGNCDANEPSSCFVFVGINNKSPATIATPIPIWFILKLM